MRLYPQNAFTAGVDVVVVVIEGVAIVLCIVILYDDANNPLRSFQRSYRKLLFKPAVLSIAETKHQPVVNNATDIAGKST